MSIRLILLPAVPLYHNGGNLNAEKLSGLLSVLDKLPICAGQPDDCFVQMIQQREEKYCQGMVKW